MEYTVKPVINFTVDMKLTENEARALGAIACYGTGAFLKLFYEKMGTSYLQPREKDVRELFAKINGELCSAISEIDKTKKLLRDIK